MSTYSPNLTLPNLADRNLLRQPQILRLPQEYGNRHILTSGTSGAGKTTLIMTLLEQIAERGDESSVVLNDPDGEYLSRFYNPARHDRILNPLDERGVYWNPGSEVDSYDEALTLAKSFFPSDDRQSDKFFYPAAAMILAALLTFKPLPEELSQWMADPAEIENRMKLLGRKMVLGEKAPEQSSGVIGTLQTRADSFRFLIPSTEAAGRPSWNSKEWAKNPQGWIFLTAAPNVDEALIPLHSFWFDVLVMRLRSRPAGATPVTFLLDELASLQFLPQLVNCVLRGRRANISVIMGLQHKELLDKHYGCYANPILAMPDLKFYLRAGDFSSAEWTSLNIGEAEVERISTSSNDQPQSETERSETLIKRLVIPREIQDLPNFHAFMQYPGQLVRLQFPYRSWPQRHQPFVPRQQAPHIPPEVEGKAPGNGNHKDSTELYR